MKPASPSALPLVSIITPLHNKGPYIDATIRSVLGQEMTDWELIVVENGSTDNGPAIASAYPERDPRIHYLVAPVCGPGAARNAGLDRATGEWVLFLDADDLLHPGYLAERLDAVRTEPAAGIVAGPWTEFTDGAGEPLHLTRSPAAQGRSAGEIATEAVASAPWVLHAALVRRALLDDGHRWPEALDRWPSEDAAFWFPLVTAATTAWARGNGAAYRVATPAGRDCRDDVARRTEGLLAVIAANTRHLSSIRLEPTPGQVATLVRVLERAYLDCTRAGHNAQAAAALTVARTWLAHPAGSGSGLLLRRILGIPLFNRLNGRLTR